MINASDYTNMKDLTNAITAERNKIRNESVHNINPSIDVRVLDQSTNEYYVASVTFNWMTDEWMMGMTFKGNDNQGGRYSNYIGARRFDKLQTIANHINTWNKASAKRIALSMKRWKELGHTV